MKLFTLNATPVRNFKQLTPELQRDIRTKRDTLKDINARAIQFYADDVAEVLKVHAIDGFTIYQVQGYWMGESEVSFKIEIAIDSDPERVYTIAKTLRNLYNQDSVMLTLPNNSVNFI